MAAAACTRKRLADPAMGSCVHLSGRRVPQTIRSNALPAWQAFKRQHLSHVNMPTSLRAQASSSVQAPSTSTKLLMTAVEALFRFPPLFEVARNSARTKIVKRGEALGDNWEQTLKELGAVDWTAAVKAIENPSIRFPAYYTQPFHAYPEGNLSVQAAVEVDLAARSVHATVFDPDGKALDPEGDLRLRSSYGERMVELLAQQGITTSAVTRILDLGCSTGRSSIALLDSFPSAHVTGVDLSPHFLAVGRYQQQQREATSGRKEALTFMHAAAEQTGLPSASFDLVSICLVCHELPQAADRDIFREAYRLLRPGGALAIMEMNPASPVWQRVFNNPFAFAGFKSTEPWLQEYLTLDLHQAMMDQGFNRPLQAENTPRHRTVVAVKPA